MFVDGEKNTLVTKLSLFGHLEVKEEEKEEEKMDTSG